jgi:hypothetical protein
MPQGIWTISSARGGNDANDLVGCHIVGTATGYDFTAPNNAWLASTTDTTLPFSFNSFLYDDWTWTVEVNSLGNPASGDWSNNNPSPTEEEGTWSAGATIDTDSSAASANV